MVFEERVGVLCDRVYELVERRLCLIVDGVRVRGGDHVGLGLVDGGVDYEGGGVHGLVVDDDFVVVVD